MNMRPQVAELVKRGRLPSEETATPEEIKRFEQLIREITMPVTDDEASAMVSLFGLDDCFGLAASLVARIETSPKLAYYGQSQRCRKSMG